MLFSGKETIEQAKQNTLDNLLAEVPEDTDIEKVLAKQDQFIDYLDTLDIDKFFANFKVLGTEIPVEFELNGNEIIGRVDLIIEDKNNGETIIVDHKSSGHFLKKDGTPLKSKLDQFNDYKKQLYIYAMGVKQKFGISAQSLAWNHFLDKGAITEIPYREDECEETKNWVLETINLIENDQEFAAKKSFLWCNRLCSFRNDCLYKEMEDEDAELS